MRPLALVLALAALAVVAVVAGQAAVSAAAERRGALTLRTSLGPIDGQDTRDLRARGSAPAGSKLLVRFFRGDRRVGLARPGVESGRYAAATPINRTGEYVVRVTATTLAGRRLRVSAKLNYGPKAEAPSAP